MHRALHGPPQTLNLFQWEAGEFPLLRSPPSPLPGSVRLAKGKYPHLASESHEGLEGWAGKRTSVLSSESLYTGPSISKFSQ